MSFVSSPRLFPFCSWVRVRISDIAGTIARAGAGAGAGAGIITSFSIRTTSRKDSGDVKMWLYLDIIPRWK